MWLKLICKPTKELRDGRRGWPRSYQPIKGPSAEPQRSTGAQWQGEAPIKDSEEETPCQGPSQGSPRKPSDPLSRCENHHKSTTGILWTDGVSCLRVWGIMGCRGIAFSDCRGFTGNLGTKDSERVKQLQAVVWCYSLVQLCTHCTGK